MCSCSGVVSRDAVWSCLTTEYWLVGTLGLGGSSAAESRTLGGQEGGVVHHHEGMCFEADVFIMWLIRTHILFLIAVG